MNFSYANRVLKAELQRFLDLICKDVKRPVAKLFFGLVYGVMRSGSTLVSRIGRALCEPSSINVTENRLTQAIASADPSPIESGLADYALGMSSGFLALDERDVQKPYGKAFQWLDDVMDGSDPDKKIGKGYHVIGMASVSQRNQPIPFQVEGGDGVPFLGGRVEDAGLLAMQERVQVVRAEHDRRGHREGQAAYPRGALQAGIGGDGDIGAFVVEDDPQGEGQIEEETYPTNVGY